MVDVAPNQRVLRLQHGVGVAYGPALRAGNATHDLAREVGRSVADAGHDPFDWRLQGTSSNGVVTVLLDPHRGDTDVSVAAGDETVAAITSGMRLLESEPTRPDHFTDTALERARDLANLGVQLGTLALGDDRSASPVTEAVAANVGHILSPAYQDEGTIEGTLESVNLHGERYFNVYDVLSGRRIKCTFARRIPVDRITDALERRVAVSGMVEHRPDGYPVRVIARGIEVFPPDDELPSYLDVHGILH